QGLFRAPLRLRRCHERRGHDYQYYLAVPDNYHRRSRRLAHAGINAPGVKHRGVDDQRADHVADFPSELVTPLDLARDSDSCLALPRTDLAQAFLGLWHHALHFGPVGTTSLDHPTEVVLGRRHQRLGARTGL